MRSPAHLAATLAVLSIAWLVAAHPKPAWTQSTVPPTNSNALYKQPGAPIDRRVDDLLSRMTLDEKVRQLDL